MQKLYLLFFFMFYLQSSFAQTSYNPYVQSIHFQNVPSASGFECGTTQTVVFTQGLTSLADATQWQTNPMTISICLSGFVFEGSATSIISGAYASNFTWSYDLFAPNCLIGIQNQTLIGSGPNTSSPNPLSFGTISINVKVPENTALNTALAASVNIQAPGYMSTYNIQGDDDATAQTVGFCSCYSFITNAGTISGNQSFFNSGNPVPFSSVTAGSGGSGGSIVYQWQQQLAGVWTDISGATNLTYDAPLQSVNTSFRRKAKRSLCGTWMNSNQVNITIVTPNAGPDATVTCTAPSTILGSAPVSGMTYAWAPSTGLSSVTAAQPVATPTTTTTYTMTMTDANSATSSDVVIVSVNKTSPTMGASATSSTICAGASTTLNATGAISYNWTPGALSGSSISVSPASSTTYTVTGTATNGCTGTAVKLINVNPLPTVGSTATFNSLCEGGSTTLTGTGANIYTWNFGATYTNTITVTPPSTTTYAVIGTNTSTGCTNISTRTITVNTLPVLNVSASPASICPGSASTITATGASSYSWQPGALSGSSVSVSPTSTTTYTVTGTSSAGCTKTSTRIIVVSPCGSVLNLKFYIQGYYLSGGLMDHVLLNESVAGANTTRTDSVTIELRNSTPPYMVAASQKVILNTNGTCVGNFSVNGNYFIVVKHRNMIDTWSANPVNIGAIPATYDFSTASAKAFGNNMIQVSNNIWACYSGDINRDENADLIDMSALEVDIEQFQFGYFNTDLNGDGNVDLLDSPILENNISNFVYSTHP